MENKISVILTLYTAPETGKEMLEELVLQKVKYYPETEIIVVNDCSPKDMSFVKDYLDNITYIELTENKGCAGARNAGLDVATGRYITFVDDDDRILPNYLHNLYRTIRQGYHYAFVRWSLNGEKIDPKFSFEKSPVEVQKALWGYIFNRELLNMGHFDESLNLNSDIVYLEDLLTKDMSYGIVPQVIYDYSTLNGESLTRRYQRGEITREKSTEPPIEEKVQEIATTPEEEIKKTIFKKNSNNNKKKRNKKR